MSTVTSSRGADVRRFARVIQSRYGINDVFLEGHTARCDLYGNGVLLIFDQHLAFGRYEAFAVFLLVAIETLRVVPTRPEVFIITTDKKEVIRFDDLERADEVGRVVHFLQCKQNGKLDERLTKALTRVPLSSPYARSLARYPQHHHDLYNIFGLFTILHPPPDANAPPKIPGDAAFEFNCPFDAVLGFGEFWGLQVLELSQGGMSSGLDVKGILHTIDSRVKGYITVQRLCLEGVSPLPILLEFNTILAVTEYILPETGGLAVRVTAVTNGGCLAFVLAAFPNDESCVAFLEELTLAWAQALNRNYSVGQMIPVLNNTDLLTIVKHYQNLDAAGFGVVPRDDFMDALGVLDPDQDTLDVLIEAFDITPDKHILFAEFLVAMRTFLAGTAEDKADAVFRYYDYQRQGYFTKGEFMWVAAVLVQSLEPSIRRGYERLDLIHWLYNTIDKRQAGYVTHREFVEALRKDDLVRKGYVALRLVPPERLSVKYQRQPGQPFIAMGHPRFDLVCAIAAGMEMAVKRTTAEIPSPANPYKEMVHWDIDENTQYDPEEDWDYNDSNLERPSWSQHFPLGSTVSFNDARQSTAEVQYKVARGTVVGYKGDMLKIAMMPGNRKRLVPPEAVSMTRKGVICQFRMKLNPNERLGLGYERGLDGLPYITEIVPGGPAERTEISKGMVIDSIEGIPAGNKEVIEAIMKHWKESKKEEITIQCVYFPKTQDNEYEPGARVEVVKLVNKPEYNHRNGTVLYYDREQGAYSVSLDGDTDSKFIGPQNLRAIMSSEERTFRLLIPQGATLGFQYRVGDDGILYVSEIEPGGPAVAAGLPLRSYILGVQGLAVSTAEECARAIHMWRQTQSTELQLKVCPPLFGAGAPPRTPRRHPIGSKVVFTDFTPRVFAEIRSTMGLTEEDYLFSVGITQMRTGMCCGTFRPFLEMLPGTMWFATHDKRFVIRRLSEGEGKVLVTILPDYQKYLEDENTLLVKYVGLHSIRWQGSEIYFCVLANAFPMPHKELFSVYELRVDKEAADPDEPKWGGRRIKLAPFARECLLEQLEKDTEFLATRGMASYALLVGVHSVAGEIEAGDLDGCGEILGKCLTSFMGSPCPSMEAVYRANGVPTRFMKPSYPKRYKEPEVPEPSNDHEMKRKLRESVEASPFRTGRAPETPAHPYEPPPPDPSNPEVGWVCNLCGTTNAWSRTIGHGLKSAATSPQSLPACSGCYASYDDAVKGRPHTPPLDDFLADMTKEKHPTTTPSDTDSVEEEVEREFKEVMDELDEAIKAVDKHVDPFAVVGWRPPLSPKLAKPRPGIDIDPSGEHGMKRSVFQKFYGGVPGLLVQEGDVPLDTLETAFTEIFYCTLVNILHKPADDLSAEDAYYDAIDYQERFLEYIGTCFL